MFENKDLVQYLLQTICENYSYKDAKLMLKSLLLVNKNCYKTIKQNIVFVIEIEIADEEDIKFYYKTLFETYMDLEFMILSFPQYYYGEYEWYMEKFFSISVGYRYKEEKYLEIKEYGKTHHERYAILPTYFQEDKFMSYYDRVFRINYDTRQIQSDGEEDDEDQNILKRRNSI